jgi:hypothetical protein
MAVEYGLRDCNNQLATIYTDGLLTPGISGYINQIVYIAGYPDNCWYVTQNAATGPLVPVTVINSYSTCEECVTAIPTEPPTYKLTDCTDPLNILYTTDALTPGVAGYNNGVVFLSEYLDKCWKVSVSLMGSPLAYNIITFYNKCSGCIAALPPVPTYIFRLINCVDKLNILYSFTQELGGVVGSVVNLTGYEGICWSVSTVVYNNQVNEDVSILVNENGILQIFEDCECCLPAPEPEPVKYTRVIPKPDRAFYQITQSQCDIQANIRFADNYYRLFKKLKYGMNSMCDNVDLDRVCVKKMQSYLAVINDPTACVITPAPEQIFCPVPS